MKINHLNKKYFKFNIIVLIIILLFGSALLYFLYYRQRNQEDLYVAATLVRNPTQPANISFNWMPYWVEQSVEVGDKDVTPLGRTNAVVLEKNSYEADFYGKYVYLLLKINAVKDRSGIYLYKNSPLGVGRIIDLKLTKSLVMGLVTYVGIDKPKYQLKKLQVTLIGQSINPWEADNLKIGSTIIDSKGEILVKVIDKKVTMAEVRADTAGGISVVSYDKTKRDLEAIVEIIAKKIDDTYYYAETQKVKVNEWFRIPFKEVSLDLPIAAIKEL